MELIVKSREVKPLLSREEIRAVVKQPTIPTTEEIKTAAAQQLNKQAELIVIKKIHPKFGKREVDVQLYIYESSEALKRFEPKPKVKKEAKEEVKEEKKPEEAKEEKKEEAKEVKEEVRKEES